MCPTPTCSPAADAVSQASSSVWSAVRASPPARAAMAVTTSSASSVGSAAAPRRITCSSCSSVRGSSSITVQRESSAWFTSKYGFSVVAPINVTSPSSTACNTESCWRLSKRWISSMKRIVRMPLPPSRSRARARTARTSSSRADTADSSSSTADDNSATIRAIVVFPTPGGPWRIIDGARPSSIARRSTVPGPRTCSCPMSSSSERGRTRCGSGAIAAACAAAESLKRSLIEASMLTPMSATDEDFDTPILPGGAPSDYERYLNTEELLALQKRPEEWVHRDELLFQVVHQSSELWLKLAGSDIAAAAALVDADDLGGALRLLRRSSMCMRFITGQLDMLEQMSPWEYQEIRKVLGHGSGFDSPGVKELRPAMARLGEAFHAARERAGLSLLDLYVHGREHELLYQLAEALMELDEWLQTWRIRHYRVVARVIGEHVIGTQGTPVEVLGRLIHRVEYQELWDVRNELTAKSQAEA